VRAIRRSRGRAQEDPDYRRVSAAGTTRESRRPAKTARRSLQPREPRPEIGQDRQGTKAIRVGAPRGSFSLPARYHPVRGCFHEPAALQRESDRWPTLVLAAESGKGRETPIGEPQQSIRPGNRLQSVVRGPRLGSSAPRRAAAARSAVTGRIGPCSRRRLLPEKVPPLVDLMRRPESHNNSDCRTGGAWRRRSEKPVAEPSPA
jgi:hypothetical protein